MWTSPRTWVTSEDVTATILDVHIRDNLLYLYAPPRAKVHRTSNVEVTSTGQSGIIGQFEGTHIEFDKIVYDNDQMSETDSKVNLESKTAGIYLLTGAMYFLASASDHGVSCSIVTNDSPRCFQIATVDGSVSSVPVGLNTQTCHSVPAGDLIALHAGVAPGPIIGVAIGVGDDAPFGGRGPMLAAHWLDN